MDVTRRFNSNKKPTNTDPDAIALSLFQKTSRVNSSLFFPDIKMGKGKKSGSSKSAEKKKERLEMERLMNSRVQLVKAANSVEDPLENLPSFKV